MFVLPKFIRGSSGETHSSKASKVVSSEKQLPDDGESPDDGINMADEKVSTAAMKQRLQNGTERDEPINVIDSNNGFSNSISDISEKNQRKTDANYLLKNIIAKEVNKIKNETDILSNRLMEKIEAANIEGLIDKTVSGFVELKDDLMRMNEPEVYGGSAVDGLRKRNMAGGDYELAGTTKAADGVDKFLKKEIHAIKEAKVIPTVLSNGQAK